MPSTHGAPPGMSCASFRWNDRLNRIGSRRGDPAASAFAGLAAAPLFRRKKKVEKNFKKALDSFKRA